MQIVVEIVVYGNNMVFLSKEMGYLDLVCG
jgi:hypothetical protein